MEFWIFVLILKRNSKLFESSNSVPFCDNNQSFFNVAEIFSHYCHSAYLCPLAGNRDRQIEDFVIGVLFDNFRSDEILIVNTPEPETHCWRKFWDHQMHRDLTHLRSTDMWYDLV
jgi:hypothetical protein